MEREKMRQTLREALGGSRKIRITFKKEAIPEIPYLLGMLKSGIIKIDTMDEITLRAVINSKKWDGDANRTLTATLTDQFDEDWFVGRMERALESISVAK